MALAACGTAADTPDIEENLEGTRASESATESPVATTQHTQATPTPTATTQAPTAATQAAPAASSSTQATAQTEPASAPATADGGPLDDGGDTVESDDEDRHSGRDDSVTVDNRDGEGDAATIPQVTFPEASVRDPEAEAADLERRRSVIGLFERLRIEVEHRGGYNRDAIFPGWLYSNGRSTRERVLAQEQRPDGTWNSAYDNTTVASAGDLDIDHLVPLAEAWESGGYAWSQATWTRFANDLGDSRSLIAVSSSTNRSKGSRDPHGWWPSRVSYRCQYAADWVAVKARWDLSADTAERHSLDTQLSSCTGAEFEFVLPAMGSVTIEESSLEDASSPETPGETGNVEADSANAEAAAPDNGCHPAYEPCLPNLPGDALNCGDLTSSQKPVRVKVIGGDPYRLDRDRNGVGCQS